MFLIAYDYYRIIKSGMFFDDGLYIANFGAGGINDFDAAFLNFFSFSRSNTVGTNN
jgi:hypothetical protein